jgi:ankyrin repeat protein
MKSPMNNNNTMKSLSPSNGIGWQAFEATRHNDIDELRKLLIDNHDECISYEGKEGRSSLIEASKCGHVDCLELLIQAGSGIIIIIIIVIVIIVIIIIIIIIMVIRFKVSR